MAFGKKKDAVATADAEDSSEVDAPEDEADAPADEVEIADAEAPAEEPAPAEAAAPAGAGSDALLSMFAESKTEAESDLTVLVNIAGETDIDDILEELRTLRAALGITSAYDDEEDFAATA